MIIILRRWRIKLIEIPEIRSHRKEDRTKKIWWEIRKDNSKFFVYDNINGYGMWRKKCKFANLWCSMIGLGFVPDDRIALAKTSPSLATFISLEF